MGLRAIEVAHPSPEEAMAPAVVAVKAGVTELLGALDRYRVDVEAVPRRPMISLPAAWNRVQANAMAGLLHRMADAIVDGDRRR
jgi:hypothetical protein